MDTVKTNNLARAREAMERRQEALDYINEQPGAYGPEIAEWFGWGKSTCAGRLSDMVAAGELTRTPALYKKGIKTFRYFALKTVTSQPEVLRPKALEDRKRAEVRKAMPPKKSRPGVIRNDDPDRPPIRGQGGQGNVRHNSWGRQEAPSWT
jgi:hypothetical protein